MDPQTVFDLLCESLQQLTQDPMDEELRMQCIELLGTLTSWLELDGFPPVPYRKG
jgi:hypothetical protein